MCGAGPDRRGGGSTRPTTSTRMTPGTPTGARRSPPRSDWTARRLRLMDTAEYEARGLYDPTAPNAADRLALLEWLADRGFGIEQMVEAAAASRLTAVAGDLALRPGERLTMREVAKSTGLTAEQVRQMSLTFGLPVEDFDERIY